MQSALSHKSTDSTQVDISDNPLDAPDEPRAVDDDVEEEAACIAACEAAVGVVGDSFASD